MGKIGADSSNSSAWLQFRRGVSVPCDPQIVPASSLGYAVHRQKDQRHATIYQKKQNKQNQISNPEGLLVTPYRQTFKLLNMSRKSDYQIGGTYVDRCV